MFSSETKTVSPRDTPAYFEHRRVESSSYYVPALMFLHVLRKLDRSHATAKSQKAALDCKNPNTALARRLELRRQHVCAKGYGLLLSKNSFETILGFTLLFVAKESERSYCVAYS